MNSTSSIRQNGSIESECFLITETIDEFRWVGPVADTNDWGLKLARVRGEPVSSKWQPVPIEWLPETVNRKICDFPNFRSAMLCLSKRAAATELRPMLE